MSTRGPTEIEKIQTLLQHQEYATRRQGSELARALGDWSAVVEGCIGQDGSLECPFGFLTESILELVFTVPGFDPSTITTLDLTEVGHLESLDALAHCTSLFPPHWDVHGLPT